MQVHIGTCAAYFSNLPKINDVCMMSWLHHLENFCSSIVKNHLNLLYIVAGCTLA